MQNTVYDNRLSGKQDTGRAEARPPNPQPKTHKPRTYTRGASPPEPPRRMGGIQGGQAPLSPVGPGTGDGPLRWKMNPPSPGDREPGTRNREPGTGNQEPGTGNQEPGTREDPLWKRHAILQLLQFPKVIFGQIRTIDKK